MAVYVPVRPESKASVASDGCDADWMIWLGAYLSDRQWLGLIEFGQASEQGALVAVSPQKNKGPAAAMLVARKARVSGRVTTVRMPGKPAANEEPVTSSQPVMALMAVPLPGDEHRLVLLYGPEQTEEQQKTTIATVRWASVWLNRAPPQIPATQSQADSTPSLAGAVLNAAYTHQTPEAVSRAMVNLVKRMCGCERVSLAIHQHPLPDVGQPSLICMSDQASVDVRRVLPAQVIATVQESLLSRSSATQAESLGAEVADDNSAQAILFREHGRHPAHVVLYPPLHSQPGLIKAGAPLTRVIMLLERATEQTISDAQVLAITTALEPSLHLIAQMFDKKMPRLQRVAQRWHRTTEYKRLAAIGSHHRWKLVAGGLLACSILIPVPHKVSAHAAIEAKDLQILIAPQNGFVSASHVRAGDIVKKDQLLATLDSEDLKLAAGKWRSEFAKNEQSTQQALATNDRVALGRHRADAVRIAAEAELVHRQIERSQLRAPFDGVVLSGDLSQQLGAAVTRGETLFTVAASAEYRLVLELEEQDVGLIRGGQTAQVRLAALPNSTWSASVDGVLPVAMTTAEQHVFRVPALFSERSSALLPGMEGVARLHVGSRSLAWVYTRALREKARLLLWRLGVIG